MDAKHAAALKVLAEHGMLEEKELSVEEQNLLDRALDPEKEFEHKVKELFKGEE